MILTLLLRLQAARSTSMMIRMTTIRFFIMFGDSFFERKVTVSNFDVPYPKVDN